MAKASGLAKHFRLTGEGLLGLYGADFVHAPLGPQTAIAVLHLAGLALAAWALCRALRRFARTDDLLVQVLTVGILADVAAFAFSSLPRTIWDTRQISAVLPFGAALAGRLLAGDLLRARLVPALAVLLACYTAALGFDAAQPDIPAHDQALADWLVAHHFTYGLSNYYEGNITTLDSGGRVHLVDGVLGRAQIGAARLSVRILLVRPAAALRELRREHRRRPAAGHHPAPRPAQRLRAPGRDLPRRPLHHHGVEQEPAHRPRPAA